MLPQFAIGYSISVVFLILSFFNGNNEFVIYAFTAGALFFILQKTHNYFNYHPFALWGANAWLITHILGGLYPVGDSVLYGAMLIPLVGEPYFILKYDQLIHVFCYFVIALLVFPAVKRISAKGHFKAMVVITVLAAAGIGSINEIIEFSAVVVVKDTGVGDYYNTAIDIVANMLGAILAIPFFRKLYGK